MQIDDSPAVQHPTLLEDVVKTSSKEQMAAKLQEKREKQEKREPEGLLAQGLLQATWHVNACDMCFGPFRRSHEHTKNYIYMTIYISIYKSIYIYDYI